MSKKTKKGPHPHDKKEQQQIAGCPRCRGKEVFGREEIAPVEIPPLEVKQGLEEMKGGPGADLGSFARPDIAPLEVLPLSSVPLEGEPAEEPESPPVVPEGFSPH